MRISRFIFSALASSALALSACSGPSFDETTEAVGSTSQAATGVTTQPTNVSVASLYLSNWSNAQNIWMASKLAQTDVSGYGPRLAEMRIANDWTTNQIVDYSDFFRDETHGVKYDQPHNFNSQAYLDETGILHTQYLDYSVSHQRSRDARRVTPCIRRWVGTRVSRRSS